MSGITTAFSAVSDFLSENFGIVEVAFGIAVGVLTYYATMTLISAANTAVLMASTAAATVATWASTAAKIAETYAQEGLNAALYACPITWIVGGIIALIGVFYLAVSAVNYFAGTSISATGLIFGAFAWLWGGIRNGIAFVWNGIASFANFLGNVFNDPLNATYNLFADIWNGIVDLIGQAVNSAISLIKKIPGMDKIMGDTTVNAGALHIERKAITGGETTLLGKMDYVNQMDYAESGYKMGENLFNIEMPTPTIPDYKVSEMESSKKIANPDGTPKDSKAGKETANNTKRMADAVEMTADEIKELRESAVQSALNQFNQSHVIVNVDMENNISNEMELDGVTSKLLDGIRNAVGMKREGVAM